MRSIVKAYNDMNILIEFTKKEAKMKLKHLKEWKHTHKGLLHGGWTLSSLFGGFETVSTIFFFHFSQLSIQVANPICLVLQPSVASQALLTYLEQKWLEVQR